MLTALFLALILLLVQTFIPAVYKSRSNSPEVVSGPQDNLQWSPQGDRAQRALRNLLETLPIFLTLALLSLVLKADTSLAVIGAGVYLVARVLYVPMFIMGIPKLRSLAYVVSLVGLVILAVAVLQGAGTTL